MPGTGWSRLAAGVILVCAGLLAKAFAEPGGRWLLVLSSVLLAAGALLVLHGLVGDGGGDHL